MAFKKQHIALIFALLLATAGVVMIDQWLRPARQAPETTFELLDGRRVALASYLGRPLLVIFWATSCKTCAEHIPVLKQIYHEFKPRGFELIAVAMPYDPPNYVKTFNDRNRLPYPVAIDTMGKVVAAFGDVPGTPTVYLINPSGEIVHHASGNIDLRRLRQRIKALLAGNDQPAAQPA